MTNPRNYFREGKFCPEILASEIARENDFLYKPTSGFYEYQSLGVWVKIDKEVIKRIIDRKLCVESNKSRIANVLDLISTKTYVEGELNENRRVLNLKNGMLDLSSYELLPHDKKYLSTIQLDANYQPDARCPLWLKFLDEVLEENEDLINIVQEFFGYCLIADTRFEKLLILVGEGSNGKSTLIAVLINLINSENISTVSLSGLENQFHRAFLHQKLVNISTEFEISGILTSGYIKSIVSGDPIDAAFKFKDVFSFSPFVRIVAAMNDLPKVSDRTFGFYRRLLIIPFNRRFGEGGEQKADKKLKHKLFEELDGILLWALEGLKRLENNDSFTESAKVTKLIKEYRKSNNPVEIFVEEQCEVKADAEIGKAILYYKFDLFSTNSGHKKMNEVVFAKELRRLIPNISDMRPNKGKRLWVGIALINN